eukprot:364449-Chlamydomonas_euryale.AAC.7
MRHVPRRAPESAALVSVASGARDQSPSEPGDSYASGGLQQMTTIPLPILRPPPCPSPCPPPRTSHP